MENPPATRVGAISSLVLSLLWVAPAVAGDPDKVSARADTTHTPTVKRAGVNTGVVAGGNVTQLFARASDSLAKAPGSLQIVQPPPVMPYNVGTADAPIGGGPYTAGPASVTGKSFIPTATADITISPTLGRLLNWTSGASNASIGLVSPPPGPPVPAETAHAVAKVTDPLTIGGIQTGDQVSFTLQIGTNAHLLIAPPFSSMESGTASDSGFDQTDLKNIGTLWNWSWSADSLHPGASTFSFASNPTLGLDDAMITSQFNSLVSYDASSGQYSLTAPFTVSTTVTDSGQTSFSYGGEEDLNADAAVVPEPSSFVMLAGAFITIGCVMLRSRRSKSRVWYCY